MNNNVLFKNILASFRRTVSYIFAVIRQLAKSIPNIFKRHIFIAIRIMILTVKRIVVFPLRWLKWCLLLFTPAMSEDTEISYQSGSKPTGKTAWIISFTGVSNEPRVLRQANALLDDGWTVVVLGYQGHSPTSEDWHFCRLPANSPAIRLQIYISNFWRKISEKLITLNFGAAWRRGIARLQHRNISHWRNITNCAVKFATDHPELKADAIMAHDFHTCEVGYALKKYFGAPMLVDCHEYARGQYMHDQKWVRQTQPYVVGMHEYYLTRADAVTTVSDGIAELMNKEEKLKRPVHAIKSVPFYDRQSFRPVGSRIKVLYHGDVSEVRGLHKAIASMPLWREEFDLIIRGAGDADYFENLKQLAKNLGLSHRLFLEGPVPFDQIVPAANRADIGYFVHYDASPQKRFVLPNKFFEYVMAGLALCVSDLPEMSRLVKSHDLGRLVAEFDEQEIANVINSFDRVSIEEYKRASLEAAKELNWQKEKTKLLDDLKNVLY
ncbi:MAG: glycosyltransferase [Roseibium sp.]